MCRLYNCSISIFTFALAFLSFLLDQKGPKNQDSIKFSCFSTAGFCHATQAVRHETASISQRWELGSLLHGLLMPFT